MFASRSLAIHLVRGAVGMTSFALAAVLAAERPLVALALVPLALVALRGCPACWTIGLVETVIATLRGTRSAGACSDGRCAAAERSPSA